MTIYQTPHDLMEQTRIASLLEDAWHCTIVRSADPLDEIDAFAWRKGQRVAAIEIKKRAGSWSKFGTFIYVDVAKVRALERAAMQYLGCAAVFVVEYDDLLCSVRIDARVKACPVAKSKGRTDRGDRTDIDDAYMVHLSLVQHVKVPEPETLYGVPTSVAQGHPDWRATLHAREEELEQSGAHAAVAEAFAAMDARKDR